MTVIHTQTIKRGMVWALRPRQWREALGVRCASRLIVQMMPWPSINSVIQSSSRKQFQGVQNQPMNNKCFKFVLAVVFAFPAMALAQTANADPLPAAPSATNTTEAQPAAPGGNKIATINVEQAIFACNEGQRDFEVLSKKLEPKQTELKGMNDEVENLKKQLNTSGDKLSEDARNNLVKQIEQKQKNLERTVQDARDDAQSQQNEIAQRILQKMAPVIVKYAGDKGYGAILDTSNPWPQGPVLWAAPSVDITKAIVDLYNVQSGVPAPARPTSQKPSIPGAGATIPATAPAKPAGAGTTTPPNQPK